MLNYAKLWLLLDKRGMKKTDLTKNNIISTATLAKLGKNESINSNVIEKICEFLDCQPGDIMEYISEKKMKETAQQIDDANRILMEQLKAQGITEQQFITMMAQAMPQIIKNMYNGGTTVNDIYDKVIEENKK